MIIIWESSEWSSENYFNRHLICSFAEVKWLQRQQYENKWRNRRREDRREPALYSEKQSSMGDNCHRAHTRTTRLRLPSFVYIYTRRGLPANQTRYHAIALLHVSCSATADETMLLNIDSTDSLTSLYQKYIIQCIFATPPRGCRIPAGLGSINIRSQYSYYTRQYHSLASS